MKQQIVNIDGMCGGHCVMTVKEVLSGITGVQVGSVTKGKAVVTVDELSVSNQQLQQAIEENGYSVLSIEEERK